MKTRNRLACASAVVIAACLLLSACGRVALYQNLAEEDANEILVLLSENGIKAAKKKQIVQNEITYSIEVADNEMVKARSLLLSHNLPRRRELGLTGVYKEKGLIPTPDEQKARYLLAIKGEIINSLRRIPQVMDADVVLNVPTRDEFATSDQQHQQRPTASAVVRVKPDESGLTSVTESKVQQFISNAVEGMNPRDVTVIISYITAPGAAKPGDVVAFKGEPRGAPQPPAIVPAVEHELVGLKLDAESKDKLKVYLLIFFLVLVVLSVALMVVIVQGARMRRTLAALKGPAGSNPAIEGEVMEEGPPRLEEGPPEDEL
ncbi:MAG: hypothetical protein JXA24_03915 [Proteobacteria bacterium]|nr:hypothetical protein [Pseudomonadota bacterium]